MTTEKFKINLGGGRIVEVEDAGDIDLDQEEIYVDGERLTEARAVELAREISRRHGRKGGRPSLAAGRSPQIATRVPQALKDQIAKAAKTEGVHESDVVRSALDEYLHRHHGKAS